VGLAGSGFFGQRQAYGDSSSLVGLAGKSNRPAGLFGDCLANSQTQAGAAGGAGPRGVAAIETVKDIGQSFRIDAVAVVLNPQNSEISFREKANLYL
jgi:hypothetical protein